MCKDAELATKEWRYGSHKNIEEKNIVDVNYKY